jgi:hypothetical protein
MRSLAQLTQKKQLIFVVFAYLIFVSIFSFAYRYAINPDGISILRLSGYIVEGNFEQSVSSVWSPLIIWFIAPILSLGFDGLTSARIAIALCGAGMVLISWCLALRFDLSQDIRFITALISALLSSFWTIQFITADVLFAFLILWYLYYVTDEDILRKKKISLFCGIAGGFSFLAHQYALPFFIFHFPSLLFLRAYIDRSKERFSLKKVLIAWGIGITGFSIIASIWILTLSLKYEQFSITSKGPAAHASVGRNYKGHPFFKGGLYKPRDAYAIHVFEDPSDVKFKTWSPLESKEYFLYQLELIKNNFIFILNHFVNMSPFFTYAFIIVTLALIPIAYLLSPLNNKKKFLYIWVVTTFSIFCSGFLMITARSPRRFYAPMIIFLLLSFHFLNELLNALKNILPDKRKRSLTAYLLVIFISAFALKPGMDILRSINNIISIDQVNPYQEIADQINSVQFPSPYAIIRSSQKPHTDIYIAYYLKKQFLGRPLSGDIEGITEELKTAQAKSLLVFDSPEIAKKLGSDKRYVHLASKKFKKDSRYMNAVNIKIDEIKEWDKEINIFTLK